LFLEFEDIDPYKIIRFTLNIYLSNLRELNIENAETTKAICTRNDTFKDTSTKYECEADATVAAENFKKIEAFKDFEYTTDTNNNFVKTISKDIDFTPTVKEALKDISVPQSPNIYIAKIKEATVDNSKNPKFIITGQLAGSNADKIKVVANTKKIPFRFHNKTMEGESINAECDVEDNSTTNFVLKCDPKGFRGTLYLYQANGTVDDIDVFIETKDDNNDRVEITDSKDNINNIVYRKNSSGLSGGAIAGIIIACGVALIIIIIITILALYLRGPKAQVNNNSSIVGLKTVDNYP
jgi:hypothetical protein